MPNNDNRNNPSNPNKPEDNLSSSFIQFSNSLNKNADALKNNSNNLSTNSTSLDINTRALLEMSKTFNADVSSLERVLNNHTKDIKKQYETQTLQTHTDISDISRLTDKFYGRMDQTLTKSQRIGNGLITSFEIVGKRVISQLSQAMNRVADSYKQNFSDITVRMQWSQSDYSDMFRSMASEFLNQGLGTQFSPTDYANALSEILTTGLRGDEAERQAYRNLITNKLVPAISTNTREYRQMSKTFGDTFTQGITAISKYSEGLYGAEGLEEGQINNIISAVSASMRLQGARSGMSDEEIQSQIDELTFGINAMAESGINPDQFISTLKSTLEGTDINIGFAAAGAGTADQLIQQLNTDPLGFMERYVNIVAQENASQTGQNYVSQALGVDTTTGIEMLAAVESGALDWNQIRQDYAGYNPTAEYAKWTNALQEGFGKTIDAQADTWEENVATPLGVFESEIPRFRQLTDDVRKILIAIGAMQFFGGGKGSPLGGVTGSEGIFSKAKGTASSIFGSARNVGVASTAKSVMSSAGPAMGKALPAIGGVTSILGFGYDAVKGWNNADDESKLTSALYSMISGETSTNQMTQLQSALSGESQDGSTLSMLGNTAKWAGAGAALGSVIPGLGTAVGAIGGGILGGISNLIAQADNMKFKELSDAVQDSAESFEKLSETQSNYDYAVTKSTESQENLTLLQEYANGTTTASAEELNSALSALQAQYPEYLGNIKDLNDLEPGYLKILQAKIELEKQAYQEELLNNTDEAIKSFNKKIDEINEISSDNIRSQASLEVAKNITEGMSDEDLTSLLNTTAKEFGVSTKDLYEELNSGKSGKILTKNKNGTYSLKSGILGFGTGYDNASQYISDYSESTEYTSQVLDSASGAIEEVNSMYDALKSLSEKDSLSKSEKKQFKSLIKDFDSAVVNYNEGMRNAQLESQVLSQDDFEGISDIYDKAGSTPSFKVGAYNISSDTLANLHQGEMVLTAANAEKLRQLDAGGVSGILSALTAVTSAGKSATTAVQPVPDTSSMDALSSAMVSAINAQTEVLSNYLASIISYLTITVQNQSGNSRFNSTLTTFQGR